MKRYIVPEKADNFHLWTGEFLSDITDVMRSHNVRCTLRVPAFSGKIMSLRDLMIKKLLPYIFALGSE
ncbi:hypothetical protein HY469_04405 [Candidatus Roizmanbacteria bacterium]|nr:hypothetical protein [Candidatus Roizmanbacteria bacterium]